MNSIAPSPETPSDQGPHPSLAEAPLASGPQAEASAASAGPASTVCYDVNAAIDRILDEGASRYVRARRLYEFCCAIHLSVPPPSITVAIFLIGSFPPAWLGVCG